MEHSINELAKVIYRILQEIEERRTNHNTIAILKRMEEMETKIMKQIDDFATAQQSALDSISASLDGIATGITALDTLITNLQNSPGTLSASDQAALDAIQASSKSLVAKAAAVSTAPPVAVPPAP